MVSTTQIKSFQDIMRKDVGVDGDAQRISHLTWMIFLKISDDRLIKVMVAWILNKPAVA